LGKVWISVCFLLAGNIIRRSSKDRHISLNPDANRVSPIET
jgi:hypothetical protein